MELTELNLTEEQLTGVKNILQSEGDKIRTKYSKEISDLKSKLPQEKSEEQLAYEKEKADFMREKTQFELSKKLSNNGLNCELAKFLKVEGVEDLESYVKELGGLFGGNNFVPNKGTNNVKSNLTKEDFNKMNLSQRTKLYQDNKELYNILSK